MANLRFRVTNVAFDEEEDVAEVTAIVRDDTYKMIGGILGDVQIASTDRGGTEVTIVLPVADAMRLRAECGRMNGHDPRHEHGHEIYDSLGHIYYGLIEDD